MEHPNQQFSLEGNLQLQASTGGLISPTQSLSSEDHSPGWNVTTRRRSLPNTRSNKILPGNINTQQPAARGTKSMSAGAQERTSHGSLMNMTGTMGAANEITYTPTTHRISKAKKGKKVHACEYPGCSKIFTRAEHRKRHEANHNTVPLFQCDIEGCRKPFQRSDLLQRHIERQHNMPVQSPITLTQPVRPFIHETSVAGGSPPNHNMIHSNLGQPHSLPSQPMTNPSGAMSIGSIIEPNMRHEYASPAMHAFADFSHLPVPVAPRVPSELFYGISMSDSPYPSSDSSYSPMSDLLQPQMATQPYHPPEDLPRAQSASLESTFPQQLFTSPSPMPAWSFDQPPLSAPAQASMHTSMHPTSRHFQCEPSDVPTFVDTNVLPYDMSVPVPQPWLSRKMTF